MYEPLSTALELEIVNYLVVDAKVMKVGRDAPEESNDQYVYGEHEPTLSVH